MRESPGPRIWVAGDWNALFGFGTNILVNLLTLTGLLRFALRMPDALVFGRILLAAGLVLGLCRRCGRPVFDPHSRQPSYQACAVRLDRLAAGGGGVEAKGRR